MKISIIIPAYNVEKFLPICLDSVLSQSYQDWEVLLIDDGSSDGTAELCDQYEKKDFRIRVWHNQNQGVSASRQFALGFATGEYVLWLDSDDCIHPEFLERAVSYAKDNPGFIIQMGYTCVSEDFDRYQARYRIAGGCQMWSVIQAIRMIDEDEHDQTDRLIVSVLWGKLYPMELFGQVSFPENVRIHEDQKVIHRLFAASEGVFFEPAEMYFYRTRDKSLVHREWWPDRLYIIDCYLDRLECVKAYGDTDEGRRLIELVYRRLLICMIRNYDLMRRYMRGDERRRQSKRLTALYRRLWRENKNIALPKGKKMILALFNGCPLLTVWLFRLRQCIK